MASQDRSDLVARGEQLCRAGAYAEAAEVLTPLVKARPDDGTALRLLGLCRLRLGQKGAVELLRYAHLLAPGDPMASLHYGLGLHEEGRSAEAAALFAEAERGLGSDPAPPLYLARALYEAGDTAGAAAAARRACLRAPRSAAARHMLGIARLGLGRHAAAETAFAAALERDRGMVDAWVNLGLLRRRRGDLAAAESALRRALRLDPAHETAAQILAETTRSRAGADSSAL